MGGGELCFSVEGSPRRAYLPFDTWFAFDTIARIATCLPEPSGRGTWASPEHAALLSVDADEAARLRVDWDLQLVRVAEI